ncbi:hypothetical protein BDBG_17738 [Blastomyces gilchristii SLH14081]|uniref:Uncharacterized protein n=1 Tax=Blastomyces gilchristii (strain SLH14081) TaxID=559298 RepID=A0A179V163_BLAGS|nr:uncharacterized protein BDBG_17738 [Blastomyces gilchristii SLH14081]OAT13071.1 hypothetical protein BDBG_17738 [Blastomyces gilchristii SLH14081]
MIVTVVGEAHPSPHRPRRRFFWHAFLYLDMMWSLSASLLSIRHPDPARSIDDGPKKIKQLPRGWRKFSDAKADYQNQIKGSQLQGPEGSLATRRSPVEDKGDYGGFFQSVSILAKVPLQDFGSASYGGELAQVNPVNCSAVRVLIMGCSEGLPALMHNISAVVAGFGLKREVLHARKVRTLSAEDWLYGCLGCAWLENPTCGKGNIRFEHDSGLILSSFKTRHSCVHSANKIPNLCGPTRKSAGQGNSTKQPCSVVSIGTCTKTASSSTM